ncbi:hypothetical protein DAPPUDRAFT_304102 [Daphnia pulex]|uniref:1-acylglycerol-3-phosphate O-acyltransferase ABHD5 n=1 Tax=Daphnia pulex TaxID=6669 RepID=E9GJ70_DAPPU|nr:hypothetical protein DAPPUDRAFT_304102 [Daphnia pulex]|eukprot:EFX80395.1 hypothetical protein DAPPUDRAFT_304102 [Daphnia pulex]
MEIDQKTVIEQVPPGTVAEVDNNCWWSVSNYIQWCPTSMYHLKRAESRILKVIKTAYEAKYVNIGKCVGGTENKIWTLMLNKDAEKTPLVMLHGFASGVALWCLNLDTLARERPVYAIDLLGFGSSSRPHFSSNALEAESEMVKSIEEWRKQIGLEKFVLLGHSMGGFLASAYALQHPDRVSHVVLADPWGFPDRPSGNDSNNRIRIPPWVKGIAYLLQPFNPLWLIRVSGRLGPHIVRKARPDIFQKYAETVEDADEAISQYVYHCNAQSPTGESCFHAMMASFGWAKYPMLHRIPALRSDIPLTFIYGARSWVDRHPGQIIKDSRKESTVELHVIGGAGHHVYADKTEEFHHLVLTACKTTDNSKEVIELTVDEKPTAEEERVHELQTEISQSVLGALQATETLENP